MSHPNWQNRTLFHDDNLKFLRAMNSESVDLIATDPPFNKGRDFHATPDSLAYGEAQRSRFRHKDEDGRLYKLENLTASRTNSDSGKFDWRGTFPPPSRGWGYRLDQLEAWWKEGRIVTKRDGTPRMDGLKVYLDESQGKPLINIWTDIPRIPNTSAERTGYPTQKPLALYERIIRVSSNENDMVLDPFAGCATTCVAAERLNRQWVGIDIWDKAHETVVQRLHDEVGLFGDVRYMNVIPERTDDGETASPFLRVRQRVKEPEGPRWTRAQMYEHLLDQFGSRCQGCDREFDDPRHLELDHNTPRSDGGLNHISNRVLLCGPCNRAKSNQYTLSGLRRLNRKNGWMVK